MRQRALDFDRIYIRVSIHASVKDATERAYNDPSAVMFQSTHL